VGARIVGIAAVVVAACSPPSADPPLRVQEPAAATDLDPNPDTVEIDLVAEVGTVEIDGIPSEVWAYRDNGSNGQLSMPGPLIDVIAGMRMVVHLTNNLPESTTLHFHGMRKPNEMDGTLAVQPAVLPGESFTYNFEVQDPGLFWYHPHIRTSEQVSRGLYGSVRVRGDGAIGETADRVLILDDVELHDGEVDHEVDSEELRVGRMGNTLLINGDPAPRSLHMVGRERWRILNAANSRYFELQLSGHNWRVTGIDSGPVPTWSTASLRIAPGERYEVAVDLLPGESAIVQSVHVDRGFDLPFEDAREILYLTAAPAMPSPPPIPTRTFLAQEPLPADAGTFPLLLEEGVAPNGEPIFYVNGTPWPFADAVPRALDGIETWKVVNQTAGNHPFHLHGLFFTVQDVNGVAPPWDGLKDTVDIPPFGEADLTVHYHSLGFWMFHTHLLDHASLGMMGEIWVQ